MPFPSCLPEAMPTHKPCALKDVVQLFTDTPGDGWHGMYMWVPQAVRKPLLHRLPA